MPISFEILVPGRRSVEIRKPKSGFALSTSYPAKSHRSPKPLWQKRFDKVVGTLVHIGDPGLSDSTRRFWAFDIFRDTGEHLERVRFRKKYWQQFDRLVAELIEASTSGSVCIGIDDQFGPSPKVYRRTFTRRTLFAMHDKFGLRLNSFMIVSK